MMCSLQNNTTSIHPPNLYYSKEALKHFETKCTILTHLFNKFQSVLTMMQVWWKTPVVLFYNEHSLHDFCKIGTLQVCITTFLVMLTVYRRHRIWSRRCPVNRMWLWSGWLMHVALVFVFVTMLLKTRRVDKVSSAVWRIANFSFGGNYNLHWAINVCQKECSQIMLKDYVTICNCGKVLRSHS
jgi:hypothetical protein